MICICTSLCLSLSHLPACPEPAVSTAPWIIAIAIIIPLLVLGLLALLLLKVLLLIYVSHAYYLIGSTQLVWIYNFHLQTFMSEISFLFATCIIIRCLVAIYFSAVIR